MSSLFKLCKLKIVLLKTIFRICSEYQSKRSSISECIFQINTGHYVFISHPFVRKLLLHARYQNAQGLSYSLYFHQSGDINSFAANYDAMVAKMLQLRNDLRLRSKQ